MVKTKHRKNPGPAVGPKKILLLIGCTSIVGLLSFTLHEYLTSSELSDDNLTTKAQLEDINTNLDRAIKPFSGDAFPLDNLFGGKSIWGTLNSGQYFSLKLSSPESIETGLLWYMNKLDQEGRLSVRHLCDQNDRLNSYSWNRHDFFSFGEQIIEDQGYKLTTSFLVNSQNPKEWRSKIFVDHLRESLDPNSNSTEQMKPLSVIVYVTKNHINDHIELKYHQTSLRGSNSSAQWEDLFIVEGTSKDVGKFKYLVSLNSSDAERFLYGNYLTSRIDKLRVPISSFMQSKMLYIVKSGYKLYVLPGNKKTEYTHHSSEDNPQMNPNIVAYQMVLTAPCSITINLEQLTDMEVDHDSQPLIDYDRLVQTKKEEFDAKFSSVFFIDHKKVFLKNPIGTDMIEKLTEMARVSLSNMVGSIGYFHGLSYVGTSPDERRVMPYGPIQLLSGVPSRSFFPRGFLWDEGFHNLLLSEWDSKLSNEIVKSWFNIMNINGWMPREVILGIESMRRVPNEFIIQYITNANPPAMMIVLEKMLRKKTLHKDTLELIYPRLKAWYKWFKITQAGPSDGTFRWRGRDQLSVEMLNPKTLTSGLDDYPRASHPSPAEYHIDLRCWMALFARTLAKFSVQMKDTEYLAEILSESKHLLDHELLDALHWDADKQMYCDFGHNNEKVEMVQVIKSKVLQPGNRVERYQVLERRSIGQPVFGCVPEFGYVSLFPMLFNLLKPTSSKLGVLLSRLRDEQELWSDYGIRSLSKSSRYYNKYNTEHEKPYWRGAVWINLNYLILASLKSYSQLEGPFREQSGILFVELRENLVRNILNQYAKSNYLWEQYDDQTGEGKGSHPFTGWTSLILSILSSEFH